MQEIIRTNDAVLSFESSNSGKECIYINDTLVSEKRSLRGGLHEFIHDAKAYSVKVIPGFGDPDFHVIRDGEVIRDKASQFKQLPTVLFVVGALLFLAPIKFMFRKDTVMPMPLLLGFMIGGAVLLALGFLAKKSQDS